MPTFTAFLNLTLPELNEFVDSWNEPNNQNFEDIDDWTEELHANLVAAGSGSTWASLRGTKSSLAARLDVSILADGTIDVSSSQDILDMATSAYRGGFSNPRDRLNDGDREPYDADQPTADGRFSPPTISGPSEGFPHSELDAGIAMRSADYSLLGPQGDASPYRPWAPGRVFGGAALTAGAAGQVRFNAAGVPEIFNIDGYIFRLREDIIFEYAALAGLNVNDFVWIYLERIESNYNTPAFKYSEPGGAPAAKDLRKLKTGGDGVTSNSTFSSITAAWDTLPFKVKEGDILRITSGGAAGDYVIDALDGSTPNTKLTIKGVFKAGVSGAPFEIIDNAMPHIGAAISVSVPSDETSQPPVVAGRVYIGRVLHLGGPPNPVVTFAQGGVFDTGWLDAPTFPLDINHNLGALPTHAEIWCRVDSTSRIYRPLVRRQLVTNFDEGNTTVDSGDTKFDELLLPSMWINSSAVTARVDLLNATADPARPEAMFTDDSPADVIAANGEIRVIFRR